MTKTVYLLTCLAEECAEVAQRCTKAIRFGLEEVQPGQKQNNQQRLVGELNDLMATVSKLVDCGVLQTDWESLELRFAKRDKIDEFMDYSRTRGVLEGGHK